jgi:hypothetical protein
MLVKKFLNIESMNIWVDANKGRMRFGRVVIHPDNSVSLEYKRLTPNELKAKILKIYKTIHALSFGGRSNLLEYKILVDEVINNKDYDYFQQCLRVNFGIELNNYASINEMKHRTWDIICYQTLTPIQERLKRYFKSKMIFQNGYDIFSDDPSYITMTFSGPLSSTYSLIATQSEISFSQNGSFITLTNPNIYNVEFKRVNWIDRSTGRVPYELFQHYSINSGTFSYLTQSTYQTTIPRDHGSDYLVTTTSRNPYYSYNYSVNVSKDSFLGKIEEIDSFENNPLYYKRSPEVAKILGFKRTFLKVTKKGNINSVIFNQINETISEDLNLFNRYVSACEYLLH